MRCTALLLLVAGSTGQIPTAGPTADTLAPTTAANQAWASNNGLPTNYNNLDSYGTDACTCAPPCGGNATLKDLCCCATRKRGGGADCTDIEQLVCYLKQQRTSVTQNAATKSAAITADGSQLWIIYCGALVFFMQCGFAMLEAGAVRSDNTLNIIFKNLMDACFGALGFYCLGYAWAFGKKDAGHFLGVNNFFLMKENEDESGQHLFFFQFAFAATAATIVSGCVCERMKLTAYFVYSIVLSTWVYPVVVHWVWSSDGFLSAFAPEDVRLGKQGMIDYAGSGVVHMVGGFAGLAGAKIVGPRAGRFVDGKVQRIKSQSAASHTMLSALGVLILWFGWYGFNCGSTLAFDGVNAGKVATTTTLSAASASLTALIIDHFRTKHWDLDQAMNGVLAGLVSITASCSVVDEWAAVLIGMVGGAVYIGGAQLLLALQIDDPINAWPVHGACGTWGVLAVGVFAQTRNIQRAYGTNYNCEHCSGMQFAIQLAGAVCICTWTLANMVPLFYIMKWTMGIRVSEETEALGLDKTEHGASAYQRSFMGATEAPYQQEMQQPAEQPQDEQK